MRVGFCCFRDSSGCCCCCWVCVVVAVGSVAGLGCRVSIARINHIVGAEVVSCVGLSRGVCLSFGCLFDVVDSVDSVFEYSG